MDATADVGPPERFEPTRVPAASPLSLDLGNGAIRTVIWATGFRPDYSWLDVPVIDHKGHLRHDGGVESSRRDSMPSDCLSSAAASRRSSTARKTMPGMWSSTWRATSPAGG